MGALVVVLMLATLGVLVAGVVLMGIGGKANDRHANRLMRARVLFQGLALLLIVALFFMGAH